MFVAIINQTNPVGVVTATQVQVAVDEAAAVTAYVNAFNPPLNPADWLGAEVPSATPPSGKAYEWAYDFGVPDVVEQLLPATDRFEGLGLVQVLEGPKSDPSGGTTPFAWEDMGYLSTNLDFYYSDLSVAQFRIWGQHMTHQEGANVPQIRLSAGGNALSDEIELPDTGGVWQNFTVDTIGYVLPGGRTLFVVQTKLRNALSTIELRAVSVGLMQALL